MTQYIKTFNDTIHNNLPLLNSVSAKKSNTTSEVSYHQNHIQLFSRMLYHANLGKVIWMPSLISNGIMQHTRESELLECLEPLISHPESAPKVDVKIIDGAALVHSHA